MSEITVRLVEGDYRLTEGNKAFSAADSPREVHLTDETEVILIVPKGKPLPKVIVR
jgi:hypothetical protein